VLDDVQVVRSVRDGRKAQRPRAVRVVGGFWSVHPTQFTHDVDRITEGVPVRDDGEHVDDRFGGKSLNRGAADVLDRDGEPWREDRLQPSPLHVEVGSPTGGVVDDPDHIPSHR
jgi:hypothetical protein